MFSLSIDVYMWKANEKALYLVYFPFPLIFHINTNLMY